MAEMEEEQPIIDTDKLTYEIFSILESKFLFGYDDRKLWIPKQISSPPPNQPRSGLSTPTAVDNGVQSIKYQRGKICILSIDGSGMRSILPGKALGYLENVLRTKSGNPDARIADYIDVATGAGVGGIFTAMLFGTKDRRRPISEASDTWKFLAAQGRKFYTSSSSSSSSTGSKSGGRKSVRQLFSCGFGNGGSSSGTSETLELEKTMKELFTENGRNLTLKDTLKPVLIPCYDLSSSAPFLFSRADALETDSFDFPLWEVCRATSAEPGVFEPVSMKSIDGKKKCLAVDGRLTMSNPTAAAITHVLHNKQEFPFVRGVEDILVLSLGSGQLLEDSYTLDQVKEWKAKDWARPMARISSDGSADLVDHAVAMAFGQSRSSGNYVRVQANGSSLGRCGANVDTDGSSSNVKILSGVGDEMLKQKNVESVMFGGKKISMESNSEKLDRFAEELVLEHERRSCRIAPTVVFKQAAPQPHNM
ncbi:patatin-like protein 6 [Impatiens glandulifera]|uniref:patatin-like protein 6 n=1 Tax=Impatiens glandulifera TaxID=253017 RepID=UPI001FB1377C|nr:patatin-like protein 6 [Impatiens glandulifera]XP_047327659.1 patatin-like protein 6 [Impatiens glandulifera]